MAIRSHLLDPPIHIACAADSRYALPLSVMLQSLGSHLSSAGGAHVHILADQISPEDQCRIRRSVSPRLILHWYEAPTLHSHLPLWGRMSATTYQKLNLAHWLPSDLDRVLWLDCDMLILGDVGALWSTPLHGSIALAVPDERVPYVSSRFGVGAWRELHLSGDGVYFNAGLMQIDLAAWREHDVQSRTFDYLLRYRDRVYFWDQEALNAVLHGRWTPLDPRWNRHPAYSPAHEQPWILHFSGNLKPWLFEGRTPHRTIYGEYLARTAWAGTQLPRTWRDARLERYEVSGLRHTLLLPLEEAAMIIRRSLTRT